MGPLEYWALGGCPLAHAPGPALISPVLSKPDTDQVLFLCLDVIDDVLGVVLVKKEARIQSLKYFISKALQGLEMNYLRLEKFTYASLMASSCMRTSL
jgi:hypothetical protein